MDKKTMKKLMILAAMAVLACTVNAASATWGFTSADITDRKGDYAGDPTVMTAMLYLGTATVSGDSIDLTGLTLLATAGQNADYSFGPTVDPVPLTGLTNDSANQEYTLILTEGDGVAELVGGNTYWMVVASGRGGRGVNPMDDTDTWATFTNGTDFAAGDWQNLTVVPEPTSGLLMLLGMAGLALRRRRA